MAADLAPPPDDIPAAPEDTEQIEASAEPAQLNFLNQGLGRAPPYSAAGVQREARPGLTPCFSADPTRAPRGLVTQEVAAPAPLLTHVAATAFSLNAPAGPTHPSGETLSTCSS